MKMITMKYNKLRKINNVTTIIIGIEMIFENIANSQVLGIPINQPAPEFTQNNINGKPV